jgi:MFS family permease
MGASTSLAGLALGILGCATIAGRVGWARRAESFGRPLAALARVSTGGTLGFAIVLVAGHGGGWWTLALGALVIGATTSSWISLAMLAVIERSSPSGAPGAAAGTVMLGFYVGLGIGPPVHGFLIDHTGAYDPMWLVSILSASLAALAVRTWVVPRS